MEPCQPSDVRGILQADAQSARLETKLGSRLQVVGIVEIDPAKAKEVITSKKSSGVKGYDSTGVFKSVGEAAKALVGSQSPQYV